MNTAARLVSAGLIVVLAATGATAATLRVQPGPPAGLAPGTFATIQAALDAAAAGDLIQLAPGTYSGPGNRDLDFRDGWRPPHRAFLFHSGEGPGARVEGLTMINGQALGQRPPAGSGAAVLCTGASPTLSDCVLRRGRALIGGAIVLEDSGARLIRCRFEQNTADHGGAVMIVRGEPLLVACEFVGNTAASGGAVECILGAPRLEDCRFDLNSATLGGALALGVGSSPHLLRCVASSNFAGFGGAVHCDGTRARLERCTLILNSAGEGAGVFVKSEAELVIEASLIAYSPQGEGVAGPGLHTRSSISCTLIYGNADGDWTGPLAGLHDADGNLWLEPKLRDPGAGDYVPGAGSPCASAAGCGVIGAYDP